jgi:hypothetical protein
MKRTTLFRKHKISETLIHFPEYIIIIDQVFTKQASICFTNIKQQKKEYHFSGLINLFLYNKVRFESSA